MKNILKSAMLLTVLGGITVQAQVTLQNFSSVIDPNTYFYGSWEVTNSGVSGTTPNNQFVQGAGVYSITGTTATNADTSKIEFFYSPTRANIGSNTLLSVTAQTLASNVATSFAVYLVDSGAKTAFATFSTSSFPTGSFTTAAPVALTMQSGFNPALIDSMYITGGQPSGTALFNVAFDSIAAVSAIPEPSTYAFLAGLGVLGVAAVRRKRI